MSSRIRSLLTALAGALVALALYYSVDAEAQQIAGSAVGRLKVYVSGAFKNVDRVNFGTGFTATQDGGLLTLTASGGGAAALDAGSVGESLLAAGSVTATKLGDGSVNASALSGELQASIPFKNDAGLLEGVLYGSSAYTAAGYADGGLTDGSQNVVARGRLAFSPTAFVLEDDPDAGSTVVKAVPQFGTEIRGGNVNTTNAISTQCVDFNIPDGTTAVAWLVLAANQYDGGGVNSASYVRLGTFERTDGSIPTLMSGAFLTIGTDRRDDTNWTGVGPPTFDGGVVQINVSGAAGQTITWDCFLQLFYRPRAVRPL